jgi:hypothetical protein
VKKPPIALLIPVFGILFGYIVIMLVFHGEIRLLERMVTPAEGFTLPDWLAAYSLAQASWVLTPALVAAAVWLLVTVFHSGTSSDLRGLWLGLWIVCFAIALWCSFLRLPETASSRALPMALTVLNGALAFYLCTAFSSISTHKFAPLGSLAVRRAY